MSLVKQLLRRRFSTPNDDIDLRRRLIAEVKGGDLAAWRSFCAEHLCSKFDPACYPVRVLQAFLAGEPPPLIIDASASKQELALQVKTLQRNHGAPPLVGHGRDPMRYSEDELVAYLQDHVYLAASSSPQEPYDRNSRPFAPGSERKATKHELVHQVKMLQKHHGTPPLSGRGFDPMRYSEDELLDYLQGFEQRATKHELVHQVKMLQKHHGAPPLSGRGSDPMRYSEGELLDYLQGSEQRATKHELVHHVKMLQKVHGAPPLSGRGLDPMRYSEDELLAYIQECGPPQPSSLKRQLDFNEHPLDHVAQAGAKRARCSMAHSNDDTRCWADAKEAPIVETKAALGAPRVRLRPKLRPSPRGRPRNVAEEEVKGEEEEVHIMQETGIMSVASSSPPLQTTLSDPSAFERGALIQRFLRPRDEL